MLKETKSGKKTNIDTKIVIIIVKTLYILLKSTFRWKWKKKELEVRSRRKVGIESFPIDDPDKGEVKNSWMSKRTRVKKMKTFEIFKQADNYKHEVKEIDWFCW